MSFCISQNLPGNENVVTTKKNIEQLLEPEIDYPFPSNYPSDYKNNCDGGLSKTIKNIVGFN